MANPISLDQTLLQAILQSIPHGVLLFEPDGQILFANGFAEKLLGFQPGGWRDHSISCLFLEDDCEIFLPNIIKLTREEGGLRVRRFCGIDRTKSFSHTSPVSSTATVKQR